MKNRCASFAGWNGVVVSPDVGSVGARLLLKVILAIWVLLQPHGVSRVAFYADRAWMEVTADVEGHEGDIVVVATSARPPITTPRIHQRCWE